MFLPAANVIGDWLHEAVLLIDLAYFFSFLGGEFVSCVWFLWHFNFIQLVLADYILNFV